MQFLLPLKLSVFGVLKSSNLSYFMVFVIRKRCVFHKDTSSPLLSAIQVHSFFFIGLIMHLTYISSPFVLGIKNV